MAALGLCGILLAILPLSLSGLALHPRALRRNLVAWSFLAPSMLHLLVFTLGPLVFAAWLSLHRWSLIDVARPFIGLANYVRLLGDGLFWNAMRNTAVFTLHVPVSMAVALGLALVVHRRVRGVIFLRASLFLPTITSLVAIAMVWQWMLHDEYGLINWALSVFGLSPVPWLSSPQTALLSIMIMATWMVVGYQMVLFQAGLSTIPRELYDAARIDGAGAFSRFVHVTLPGLRHTLFFVLITSVIGSFQVFGAVYVMTEGGPLRSTDVVVFHIYREAWEFLRFGDAAAMSWILFAIIFAVTWLQFRLLEQRVEVGA
jgi:ABC-type sugar transport system permease subunit